GERKCNGDYASIDIGFTKDKGVSLSRLMADSSMRIAYGIPEGAFSPRLVPYLHGIGPPLLKVVVAQFEFQALSQADLQDRPGDVTSHVYEWHTSGGLNINPHSEIAIAHIVDETFWQIPDLKLWPETETVAGLNAAGPYSSYVDYVSAQIRQHIRLISIHKKLAFMRPDIPRLEAFLAVVPQHATELNTTKLRLAHKDLHWANILYNKKSSKITAVLDWEFSAIMPF
ncbi:MAG: hypothetical protein Q9180_008408, partial [Flavoplaca navasiana]